jgi:RNA polymerase subunit RPABC4/transcription elongation factor Spt4
MVYRAVKKSGCVGKRLLAQGKEMCIACGERDYTPDWGCENCGYVGG